MKTYLITFFGLLLVCSCCAEEKESIVEWYNAEYTKRYKEALNSGQIELENKNIPKDIRGKDIAARYYRAGYIRGVLSRTYLSGYKPGDGLGHYRRSLSQGVYYYEGKGWEAGCRAAQKVAGKIIIKLREDSLIRAKKLEAEEIKRIQQDASSDR